jgi:adenine-specific DNA-methyltransferase
LKVAGNENALILDSFSGSGTTAHAVLNMNKADGGNRKFILIEMEDYADSITAERVKRVIDGYKDVEGTGGDFTYYELGEPLLKKDRTLNEEVPLETIRQYIWHTETHTPYVKPENENPAYLGEFNHTAYYFHYKKDEKTSLDYDLLAGVNIKADSYVIYADTCLLSSEELMTYNITFKKIPRDITKI